MRGFKALLTFGICRRIKDFFIIAYNIIYPLVLILLLGYISTNFFKGDDSITSNHYYTIVLIPYFVFSSIITMAYIAKDESLYKTAYRFIIAPIDKGAIVLAKIISCTLVIFLCTMVVMLVTRILLGVSFGSSLPLILVLFFVEALMVSAAGVYIGSSFKNFKVVQGILNIPIIIFALLGGVFFPVGALGETFEKVSYISPLTWINRGIISSVYDNNQSILLISIVITLILGILFSILSVVSFNKEGFLA